MVWNCVIGGKCSPTVNPTIGLEIASTHTGWLAHWPSYVCAIGSLSGLMTCLSL